MSGPITPSKIATTRECPHYYYLECFGDRSKLREVSDGEELRMQQGRLFETDVVSKIPGAESVPWKYPDFKTGYVKTMEMLKKGPAWIHSGVLLSRNLLGVPDLLKRIDRRSSLGNYSYEPIDVKGHKAIQPSDILQLYAYAYLLEPLLGHRPERGGIWLNTRQVEEVVFDEELKIEFSHVLTQMKQIEEKKLKTSPVQCSACDTCLWIGQCTADWVAVDHVCLLTGVGASLAGKLKSAGITTCREVSEADAKTLSTTLKRDFDATARLIQAAKSRRDNKPYVLKKPIFPGDVPIYFYDIETYGAITFLHGVIRLYKGKREERSFYVGSPDEEEKAWHEFLDYVAQDNESVVYCWTNYEKGFTQKLWSKYEGNEAGYNHLGDHLEDHCKFVKDHFVLPCRGYSLKQVAPVFGFHWQAQDAGGGNCEAWYGRWLESKDPALYEKILEYNLDDVRAMDVIHHAVTKLVYEEGRRDK